MPSPPRERQSPSRSRGSHAGSCRGDPGGPLCWSSPSPPSTTDVSRRGISPAGANAAHPATQGTTSAMHRFPADVGGPRADSRGLARGPQGGFAAEPYSYEEPTRATTPQASVKEDVTSTLNLRGARRGIQGQAVFSQVAADREVYVHLTDAESGSSADEGERTSPGSRFRGSPRGYQGRPRWGRGLEGWRSRLERMAWWLSLYFNLIRRRLALGLRFLVFWIKTNERQLKVLLYTAGLLVSSTGNTIAFKRMLDKMPNYSGFLNQLTNFVFIPVFAAFCLYQYSVGKLSQEVLSFPKKNFALMGCLDGVCGIMSVVGGVHTSGTAQVVLSQLGIPVMLILCRFMLGKKYNAIQHLGAAVIIFGVLVVESPGLLHPSKEDSSNIPFFNLLFLLSILPSSLSYVVKEIAFRGVQMNTSFLQFWVALFQFFVGFVLLPLTSLPLLGKEVVPLGELWNRLLDGGKCLIGTDTIVPPDCGFLTGVPCDSCQGAWIEVFVYVLFNLIYNVCSMLVLKHCGATVLFLVMTVRLPLTSMAFYSPLIVGDSAVPAKATDFFGLLILLVGLLAFRLGGHKAARRDGEDGEDEEGEGSLDQDITATAEVAHVHIKVLASDPSIRNDGYFQ
ncbi:hypothetical protein, conserved [Eimeria tenella]|uniref:Chloroquine resistance transporter n=1 Tax=Eimeria tenella TaxID=5802 RepID=U6L1M8_EIMTE|nr:hypothetical protein, conserved [Eimeria tenella]CDJ42484.1 hypothetical protein, conserved [Eimeria tenella]|eukprot:XP_013233234.1 hypothetical protein, conserved [Eimeria tenella]